MRHGGVGARRSVPRADGFSQHCGAGVGLGRKRRAGMCLRVQRQWSGPLRIAVLPASRKSKAAGLSSSRLGETPARASREIEKSANYDFFAAFFFLLFFLI